MNLHRLGYNIYAVGHRENDNGFFESLGIQYFSVDISQVNDFSKLPQSGIYAVIHFAGALPASMNGYKPDLYITSIIPIPM